MKALMALTLLCIFLYVVWKQYVTEGNKNKKKKGMKLCIRMKNKKKTQMCVSV